ncbi:hypothetical protein [Streptomyces sp. PR69]|nr:hypothetical protein [Streptomyces sp. PR69]
MNAPSSTPATAKTAASKPAASKPAASTTVHLAVHETNADEVRRA